jgi:hypothetical protein
MRIIGKLCLAPIALAAFACGSRTLERDADAKADASARVARHRAAAQASFVKQTGARLLTDSLFPAYGRFSTVYTIDVQRRLLSDTTPIVLKSALHDVAETDAGITAIFGPQFSIGSLYLRLVVPSHLVKELLSVPRDMFGTELMIAVRPKRISRPLFQFESRDRASNSLPPALEAEVGRAFVLEGVLLGFSRIPE